MTSGQVPLVTVLMMVRTTPLDGVPAGGAQALVHVGGLKLHWVPHSTVLFDEQIMDKVQPAAGVTTNGTKHWAAVPWLSVTVKLM
jgi:hypothetical protein